MSGLVDRFLKAYGRTVSHLQDDLVRPAHTAQIRARPTSVEIVERAAYRWELGQAQHADGQVMGTGRLVTRTAGWHQDSMPRPAISDLERLERLGAPDGIRPTHGFLALHNHQLTDLEATLGPRFGHGTVALELPDGGPGPATAVLRSGKVDATTTIDYKLRRPDIVPITCDVTVVDNPEFKRHGLALVYDVRVTLPINRPHEPPPPRFERLSIEWPRRVHADDSIEAWWLPDLVSLPVHYDASRGRITCGAFRGGWRPTESPGGDTTTYEISIATVLNRPLQLTDAPLSTVELVVAVDGYLLSGLDVMVFSADGTKPTLPPVRPTRTVLEATVTFDMSKAMVGREVTYEHGLKFRGIRPTDEVLRRIQSSLHSCDYPSVLAAEFDASLEAVFETDKMVGGRKLELTVHVKAIRRTISRTNETAGGPTLRERVKAGDLDITIRGSIESDHRALAHELNELHHELRRALHSFVEA